jgi:hypothetical protein
MALSRGDFGKLPLKTRGESANLGGSCAIRSSMLLLAFLLLLLTAMHLYVLVA